jgi:hypothetical protein
VVFGVKGSYVASTAFGRRTVSVKDRVRSFSENLFGE